MQGGAVHEGRECRPHSRLSRRAGAGGPARLRENKPARRKARAFRAATPRNGAPPQKKSPVLGRPAQRTGRGGAKNLQPEAESERNDRVIPEHFQIIAVRPPLGLQVGLKAGIGGGVDRVRARDAGTRSASRACQVHADRRPPLGHQRASKWKLKWRRPTTPVPPLFRAFVKNVLVSS